MQKSWKRWAWRGFLKGVFKLRRMMLRQVVQRRQRKEGDSRNNCQLGGLHQIIKIIGHGIIHILCLCLCGTHPQVCMVIPQLLILILGMGLYIMEGCQIILPINNFLFQEPKCCIRLCILLWMSSYGRYFVIALSIKYNQWMLATIMLWKDPPQNLLCWLEGPGGHDMCFIFTSWIWQYD